MGVVKKGPGFVGLYVLVFLGLLYQKKVQEGPGLKGTRPSSSGMG